MKASKPSQCGFLFISGAVYRRIPIFRYDKPCEIFLQTLEAYRRRYAMRVHAYALMPDHYHVLLDFPVQHRLVDFLRDFKSLVGKQILEWIRQEGLSHLLASFQLSRSQHRERDARYCVLQYNSCVRTLPGPRALQQKLNYVHSNPVREGLSTTPEAYAYSSARAYAGKRLSVVKIDLLEFPYD